MQITGHHLIGTRRTSREGERTFHAVSPDTGEPLAAEFACATPQEIDAAVRLAADAAEPFRRTAAPARADFLDAIADGLTAAADPLIQRTSQETGLPTARLQMELGRTANQLRAFAGLLREGSFVAARIDRAQPTRAPVPKPDVRQMMVGLGPVAVFGASNFPLAFSTAGGDTASALAAGCPVIVKAHPAHPGCAEMVGQIVLEAVRSCSLPVGTFSLVQGNDHASGLALVEHPDLRAVGFTGSLAGGRALLDVAARRPVPIPVFAEMGSVNPVFVLPTALAERGDEIADGLAGSVTLGVGQFCTNPGIVVLPQGSGADRFAERLGEALARAPAGTTLHAGIADAYRAGIADRRQIPSVSVQSAETTDRGARATPALLTCGADTFATHPELGEEVFGPCTLLVRCQTPDQVLDVAAHIPGQLTATIHAAGSDLRDYDELVPLLEERVGRIVFDGFPTGVEVCPSMHHGGPYPATTDGRTTSVGTAAIQRFLRPICYQDAPQSALPEELRDHNPRKILRLVDGEWSRE